MTDASGLTLGIAIPPTPPIEQLFRAMALANALELEVVSTWDHVAEFSLPSDASSAAFEYQTLLGALAGRAGTVRLAVGVSDLIRRHPVVLAQAFLTLAHLTDRAPILGVGAGERANTQVLGLPFDAPVSHLEAGLSVLRACLDGKGALPLVAPAGRAPELWIGARGPRMLSLTGRFADGWYPPDIVEPESYREGLERVHASAIASGRNPDTILPAAELIVMAFPHLADVDSLLVSDEARLAGLLLDADAWRRGGFSHPLGEDFRGFVDYDESLVTSEMLMSVPSALIARHVLHGSPPRIAEQLAELHSAGLRHVNLSFGPVRDGACESLIGDVVSAVRRRLGRSA